MVPRLLILCLLFWLNQLYWFEPVYFAAVACFNWVTRGKETFASNVASMPLSCLSDYESSFLNQIEWNEVDSQVMDDCFHRITTITSAQVNIYLVSSTMAPLSQLPSRHLLSQLATEA